MGIFLKLAMGASLLGSEVAEAAEGGGWGLDFNILETNLVNLLIVYAILFYFGRGFLGKALGDRQATIKARSRKQNSASRKQQRR